MRNAGQQDARKPGMGEVRVGVKDFYRQVSAQYYRETFEDTSTLSAVGRKVRTLRVLEMLDELVAPKATVADVGCGPAQFAEPLLARGDVYIGIDISPDMYQKTAFRVAGNPRATFLAGSVESIPLADGSADAAICIGVVEYLSRSQMALAETYRILKKPGVAIFTFPNLRNPIFLLRAALRPVLAPLLRVLTPELRKTVYTSGITHRILWPDRFLREAAQCGFHVRAQCSHGYYPMLFNHRLPSRRVHLWMERWGERFLPGSGANYIVCLEK